MRLIEASTLKLVSRRENDLPPYAILSHTWGSDEDEVSFQDMIVFTDSSVKNLINSRTVSRKVGFAKIRGSARLALSHGLSYVWIDTCCIDKTSSAELSEAINSMFRWYRDAAICYAFLSDVNIRAGDLDSTTLGNEKPATLSAKASLAIRSSRWFMRGWTLQELVAPTIMQFYSRDWTILGLKNDSAGFRDLISDITRIPIAVLDGTRPLSSLGIAERMQWASSRETTRIEDQAYCLMGIFDINMPLLYGEGQKAFIRLQEEIMRESGDQSLFAWEAVDVDQISTSALTGLLAPSPKCFRNSGHISPLPPNTSRTSAPSALTNFGLQTHLDLLPAASDLGTFNAILDCAPYNSVDTGISKSSRAAIRLVALGKNQYARMLSHRIFDVLASDLAVPSQETYRQVFIKQQPALLLPDIALQGLEIISSHNGSLTHVWPQGQWDPINKMVRPRGTQRDGTLAGFRFEFHKATPKRVFLDIFVNYSMAAESSTLWTAWVSHLESDDSVQLTDVIPEAQKDILESNFRDLSFVYNIDSHPSIVFLIDRQYEQGQPLLTLKIDQIHELPQVNKGKSVLKRSKSPTNPLSDSSDPLVLKVEQIARPVTVDDSGSVSLCKLSSSFREIRTSRTDGVVDCRQSLIDIRYQVTTQLIDLVVLTPGQSTPSTFEAYFSTLLIKACIGNDTLGAEELIESRLSTAFVDSWTSEVRTSAKEFDPLHILSGFRPLHWATLYGHLDIVSILLSHGADAFPETSIGFTPAHIAIVMGHMKIFQRLFAALPASQRWSPQDRPHACDTLPNFAATYVRSEQVTSVLETLSTNMDSDGSMSTLNTLNVLGETPLHRASASNNVFAASWLVQRQRALVHRRDKSGRTPLFHAAAAGSPEICQLLLDIGADTDTRDELDRTPLHAACRHGHHAVVKLLLDAEEASVYTAWNRLQSLNFNAWHFATLSLNPEVLRCLLLYADKSNATNTKVAEMNNEAFINPINIASWVGDLDCVKILCEAGFSTITRTRWQIVPTTTGYVGLSVKISGAAYTAQEWAYQIGNYRVTRFLRDTERQETKNMIMDRVAKLRQDKDLSSIQLMQ